MEFFREQRPSAGEGSLSIDLGGLKLQFTGLDETLAAQLRTRYAPYAGNRIEEDESVLTVRVASEDVDYFIDPPPKPELNPVLLRLENERVRYLGYRLAGWFDTQGGKGEVLLAHGSFEPADRAFENYVRAAVAWQSLRRGGALVHAASAVREGRGYLFFGESGAGKSTLSASTRRATILSDDLSLVLPAADGGALELVGSPFRGTYEGGEPIQGRFPLCAGFRIFQAPIASVERVPRIKALAGLIGNLPFAAEFFPDRPDLFGFVEEAFNPVPLSHLHFRKDDSFWEAIDEAGL
jgi:hypothetical protein